MWSWRCVMPSIPAQIPRILEPGSFQELRGPDGDFLAPTEKHGLKSNIPKRGQKDISDWSGVTHQEQVFGTPA